jgi:hypothetical protein
MQETWQHVSGTVTAVCSGAKIRLLSASPADGYGFDLEKRGPVELEIKFEGNGRNTRSVTVVARCVAGAPEFSVEPSDD